MPAAEASQCIKEDTTYSLVHLKCVDYAYQKCNRYLFMAHYAIEFD